MESINFSSGQEITCFGQTNKPLSYLLVISTLYIPSIADLAPQLPKIDAPVPAAKGNLFSDLMHNFNKQLLK
ncbi:hypothetical protein [Neobacillus vireti]|uniref:hypothetical protein n=1 Tax=Neobacillus vireti TaxID=220686 RepID=UPI002FFF905F